MARPEKTVSIAFAWTSTPLILCPLWVKGLGHWSPRPSAVDPSRTMRSLNWDTAALPSSSRQAHVLLNKLGVRKAPSLGPAGSVEARRQHDRRDLRDRRGEGTVLFIGLPVVEQKINGNRLRIAALDALDHMRELVARPRPGADPADAVLIDSNNDRRARRRNRPGQPKREVVGCGIELREIGRPGEQQDRDCHDTTGGHRTEHGLHRFISVGPTGQAIVRTPPSLR